MTVTSYNLYEMLRNDQLSFIYGGEFDDAITGWVVDLSSLSASKSERLYKFKKKVSFLVVECLQNVVRHSQAGTEREGTDFFMVRLYDNSYYITSCNLVPSRDVEQLSERLENINSKSPEELKAFYLEVLQTERGNDRGGGLGLIEMARKSGQKIEFAFEDYDDEYMQFLFRLRLSSEAETEAPSNFTVPRKVIDQIRNESIHMVYRGDFSEDAMEPVLNMIEASLAGQESIKKGKKVFRSLVELFQNIRKHGVVTEEVIDGIIVIGEEDGLMRVTVSNFIHPEEETGITSKIDQLNAMDKEAKSAYFRKLLQSDELHDDPTGPGFGLVEVARMSSRPLTYHFRPAENGLTFFEICTFI